MQSELFKVAKSDFVKGALTAIFGAVLTVVYSAFTNNTGIDWNMVETVAITAFLGYLVKNFGTASNGKFLGVIG